MLNNALLIGLARAGLPLWLNLSLTASIGIGLGYVLQSKFTFRAPLAWSALGRYFLVMAPNIPVAYLLLWFLNSWLPMDFAAPIMTTLFLIWSATASIWALRRRDVTEDA